MDDGWVVVVLALLVPVILLILTIVPPYGAMIVALWGVYGDAILTHWHKSSLLIEAMQKLYGQWQTEPSLTFTSFFLPIFGTLAAGILLSLVSIFLFLRYVRNVFRVT